jgi:crotonobetainyl-CoA:carnitine CoA-transferase CaiB-like acyl-CoA transferase
MTAQAGPAQTMESSPQCLDGMRVVEIAAGVAGAYCGRLLASLGADVLKIEPPGSGDVTRGWGPFAGDIPHRERSLLFLNLNLNKRGITLDFTSRTGLALLRRITAEADVLVIADDRPHFPEHALEQIRDENPRLIVALMRPFGLSGPYAQYKAEGLTLFQAGGSGYLVPAGPAHREFPDGQPLNLPGHTSQEYCGLVASMPILAAYYDRDGRGGGQLIEVSEHEAHISLSRHQILLLANEGLYEKRETYHVTYGGRVPCADGYVEWYMTQDDQWKDSMRMMGDPEWAKDERFRTASGRNDCLDEIQEHLCAWTADKSKFEIYRMAQKEGVALGFFATPAEVATSNQEHARNFFTSASHPVAGAMPYPLSSYRLSETPLRVERAAPTLGQHNRQVYMEQLGLTAGDLKTLSRLSVV